jgi:hypothetical protein
MGAIPGSREPSPTVSALSGFDPGRWTLGTVLKSQRDGSLWRLGESPKHLPGYLRIDRLFDGQPIMDVVAGHCYPATDPMWGDYAPASCDTHPEGGDVKRAPFMGSAVGEAETP